MVTRNASLGVQCYKCGRVKLPELMYWINKRKLTPDGTRTGLCRKCRNAAEAARQIVLRRTNPEWRARYNEQRRLAYHAKRATLTPEQRAELKRQRRAGYERTKTDPVRHARHLERCRAANANYRRRVGSWRVRLRHLDPERLAMLDRLAYARRKERRFAGIMGNATLNEQKACVHNVQKVEVCREENHG